MTSASQRACAPLIILEGPDGGGKTTLGRELAARLGFRYVHLSAMPLVGDQLSRMFVEAMMPALMGYEGVVMDRCWRSEPIYGAVFRGGDDRVGPENARMLERIAARCAPWYVLCIPKDVETCLETFRSRKGDEYLDTEAQLTEVFDGYRCANNDYDFIYQRDDDTSVDDVLDGWRQWQQWQRKLNYELHPLSDLCSAGWLAGEIVMVGESFADHKPTDALSQYPFVSFSGSGCSRWLTKHLAEHNIEEDNLLWINADMPLEQLAVLAEKTSPSVVVRLGKKAAEAKLPGVFETTRTISIDHPMYAKRFNAKQPYGLGKYLQQFLDL